MTIIALDTETQGLNTRNFLMGCLCHKNLVTERFYKKEQLWARLMALGEKAYSKGECIIVYAHNMAYDYYAIRPWPEPKEAFRYSDDPFIVDFKRNGKVYMKFTSTTSLWKGKLSEIGEALGYPKGETPEWLTRESYEPDWVQLNNAMNYCERDTIIVMKYLLELQKQLANEGMRPRWLLTGAQVGINYCVKQLAKTPNTDAFLRDPMLGIFHTTSTDLLIKDACRGGRTQAFVQGFKDDTACVDINSHYPDCLRNIRMPDLRSERYLEEPLRNGWDAKYLFQQIGVSKAALIGADHPYGVLPLRVPEKENEYDYYVIYPRKKGQLLLGVWTHQEIAAAIQRGYQLKEVFWSVIWEETRNPFQDFIPKLYEKKQHAENPLERHFYKMILNGMIGKFSQLRENCLYEWDTIDHDAGRQKKGWKPVDYRGVDTLYKKILGFRRPRYYAPIINALVRADAQLRLLEYMEKIPPTALYYVDTDSLLLDNSALSTQSFKYDNTLGSFKIVAEHQPLNVWGRKAYRIGDSVKISGAGHRNVTPESFDAGIITHKRLITERQTTNDDEIGTFAELTKDLRETAKKQTRLEQRYAKAKNITDVKLGDTIEQNCHSGIS